MKSNDLSLVDAQPELRLTHRAEPNSVPMEMIRRQKTSAGAFSLACTSSGLDDKEIYLSIGLDPGYFSRMKKGDATLHADVEAQFCSIVGNTIYPEWRAYQIGCTLVQIKTEAERHAEKLQALLDAERIKTRVLTEAINGRAA